MVVEDVVGDEELHAAVRGLSHVEFGRAAGVEEEAVAAAGDVERNVFVGAVGFGAEGVEVPHADAAAAQVEGGEAFSEAAEAFVAGEGEGVVVGGDAVDGAAAEGEGAAASADVDVAAVLFGEEAAGVVGEAQVPGVEGEVGVEWSASDDDVVVVDGDVGGGVGVGVDHGEGACCAGAASGWALRRTRMTPGAEAVMLAVRVSPVVVAALRWIPWSVMSRRSARVTVPGLLCPGAGTGSSGGSATKRSWGTMGAGRACGLLARARTSLSISLASKRTKINAPYEGDHAPIGVREGRCGPRRFLGECHVVLSGLGGCGRGSRAGEPVLVTGAG